MAGKGAVRPEPSDRHLMGGEVLAEDNNLEFASY